MASPSIPARIAVTFGASGAFPLAYLSSFQCRRQDRASPLPITRLIINIATALGSANRSSCLADLETGFQPTVAMLQALDPAPDGLVIASPANPTGSMLSPLKICRRWPNTATTPASG